ncbi:MAG: NAD(P)-dependent oxidoreductase [Planctomycetes bacterium]|nr:NAD(P)-dependent oxidoreductase [Planctomycetota bacterium]
MNIIVFGAAGWTGRAVLQNLTGRHQVRAFAISPESWSTWKDCDGDWSAGERVFGDIVDFQTVHKATDGMDAVIHLAVHHSEAPGAYGVDDHQPFLVNLKGLWNVLESARQRGIRRVVHVGSCQTVHPHGVFFTAEVRRPDGSLYAVTKRLQEEMCRQFHEAFGLRIIVLRPDYIVDSRIGLGRHREKLGPEGRRARNGWVCRHDLAQACRLAAESETIDFDVFHIVGTPEADPFCNVARSREVLGLIYRGNLEPYR